MDALKPFIIYFRRVVLGKIRLRRWSTTLLVVLILLVATLLLISLLPNSAGSNHKGNNAHNNNRAGDTGAIIRPDVQSGFHSGLYGDKYAFYDDSKIGNYEPTEEKPKGRPGDEGKEYNVENEKDVDLNEVQSLKQEYGMNIAGSNRIPMDRSIPDIR